jgi:cysteine desulfurase
LGINAKLLVLLLDAQGIAVSTGSACASGSLELSYVLEALGCTKENAQGAIRISCGKENTLEEMETVILRVEEAIKQLRGNK